MAGHGNKIPLSTQRGGMVIRLESAPRKGAAAKRTLRVLAFLPWCSRPHGESKLCISNNSVGRVLAEGFCQSGDLVVFMASLRSAMSTATHHHHVLPTQNPQPTEHRHCKLPSTKVLQSLRIGSDPVK
ncbi:hypothetical protein POX_f08380 [Penicillium oxalicum]|uniref:hypothetical protein n=1 Tax=Penicillium oxalicum TaxID=69781 RepID=UPI0020B7903A|nr:hypothetical protein POX_f08380 [Penicillium oxalicum]KAI2787997.1 hypothetical protein POX_f08380 [Penicillium oxalicum]